MTLRGSQFRPVIVGVGVVVPEPVLIGLEAADDGMPGLAPMRLRVPGQGIVAAADVPARRAPAQVYPPAAHLLAFHTSGTAGWHSRVDIGRSWGHGSSLLRGKRFHRRDGISLRKTIAAKPT